MKTKSAPSHFMTFIFAAPKMRCTVGFEAGATILEVAENNQLPLSHSCGGMASCGTCRIHVEVGLEKFAPRNDLESEMAEDRGFQKTERLSCQNQAFDGLVVRVK